jgi:ADP-L-glycero-D-manno-heptose 6-epimerase
MIIVTGGAGFIGSNLVAALEKLHHREIVICDTFGTDEKWQNIKKRELSDIVHPDHLIPFLDLHCNKIKVIFHLGAISTTTEKDADLILKNNFKFSLQLMEWCTDRDVPLIYASSAATYGDGTQGFEDTYEPEDLAKFVPLNAYAWSKHVFDRRIARLKKSNIKLPPQWVGLKFFNVYGPNEYHKGAQKSVVNHIFNTIQDKKPARLFKSYKPEYLDGGQLRDFVWVDDCINVMLWFFEHQNVSGIFNVGTGKARSFKDLAEALYKALNLAPQIEYIDMPDGLAEKYQYFTEASLTHLKAAGYDKPFLSLEEGIKTYVQDYLMVHDPYR